MKEVKDFLDRFVQKELEMHEAYRKRNNIKNFNKLFLELNAFTVNTIEEVQAKIGFGVTIMTDEHDEEFFEDLEFMPELKRRIIYKISEYNHPIYQNVWLVYTSNANSGSETTKLLTMCFCISKIDGKLKICVKYITDYNTQLWKKVGGFDNVDFYALGIPVLVERLVSPLNDPWSIEEYKKNA